MTKGVTSGICPLGKYAGLSRLGLTMLNEIRPQNNKLIILLCHSLRECSYENERSKEHRSRILVAALLCTVIGQRIFANFCHSFCIEKIPLFCRIEV